jgi:hypothetical protein
VCEGFVAGVAVGLPFSVFEFESRVVHLGVWLDEVADVVEGVFCDDHSY